jgi:hypothetical protein
MPMKSTSMKTPKVTHSHAEPFYSEPKNLMVIGAVIILFLIVVMLLSGGSVVGMGY